ncbi:unnamed protein product [Schistosoma mattheei]|uniref:Uncharacterized protein n=1 Tax=Schistosoma mattheei TaxID=31246 RepID=A0A183P779_9TREM|nr:unnamed protein product [Schistosoma mattheei]
MVVGGSQQAALDLSFVLLGICQQGVPKCLTYCRKCGEMSDDETPVCNASESILYSWAMGAPSFEMPDDVSFKVGYETPYKYFVLQVHYKDAMNLDEKDTSGLELTTQSTPTGKLAGIYILVSGEDIGPSQIARLDVACSYTGNATLHPFAFRVHTHSHGVLSKGYVVDGNESYLIGSKSPQEHQVSYEYGLLIYRQF